MVHSVSLSTLQVKWLTFFKPVPPCGASQEMKLLWFVSVLQLIVTGSPYFTTTLAGLSLRGELAGSAAK